MTGKGFLLSYKTIVIRMWNARLSTVINSDQGDRPLAKLLSYVYFLRDATFVFAVGPKVSMTPFQIFHKEVSPSADNPLPFSRTYLAAFFAAQNHDFFFCNKFKRREQKPKQWYLVAKHLIKYSIRNRILLEKCVVSEVYLLTVSAFFLIIVKTSWCIWNILTMWKNPPENIGWD